MDTMSPNKIGSEGSERDGLVRSEQTTAGGGEDKSDRGILEHFGWVYHLGVNSIGHEYCHLRFLFIRGKCVAMYKCDPLENPGNKPIRKGAVGSTLMVEDLGRRNVNNKDVYVLRFYNRLDESKKGEIACAMAGEAQKWMEAFEHAKQQCEKELARGGSARHTLNMETEINLEGHRPRVRRYAYELRKLIKIGQGHETLMPQPSELGANLRPNGYFDKDAGDVIETHAWMCVRTISGVRILEDVADSQSGKGILVKSVGVVDANADTTFEVVMNIERSKRYEWDTLTCDLELVDSYDGHYDVVYGMYDPKYLSRWHSKRDFVFSRRWFQGQDGTYTILQFPTEHKKKPPRSGYRRTKINPSTWEIRNLNTLKDSSSPKCLVTQTLEINLDGWCRWKKYHCSKFEKSIPYALLTQVAGLKEYIGVNPALKFESFSTVLHSKVSDSDYGGEYEEAEVQDEFYDAIAEDSSSSSEDEEDEYKEAEQGTRLKLKSLLLAISGLALKRISAPDANKVFDPNAHPILIDPSQFSGSFLKGKDEADTNCWTSPSGMGFMIRGKNYLKDNLKVMGGDPLLTLLTADWLQVDKPVDKIALDPKSLVQSESGKKLPFILIINLQVPAKPNYSLVLYYAADRSLNANSLLAKFVDGSDSFRDSRFKLIPSIVEGYWMVKRAVGTKACLLGKAVKCKYFRQDNFLEIDVDIGSSSVARSVIGLVLGYVTSIVVDLAILIEAKEEEELPEFILGTVRLNRVRLDSAVPLEA